MSSLNSYLTNIADAIREKKGTTEPINASNFASEILSIQGGGSLNVAYSLTPPTDTSKIWLQCAEPSGVEVQNYLGECAVSSVANWGVIEKPTTNTDYFSSGRFSPCYIGNNQIAIVGKNHIRIYDLTTKSYTADYTISVGTNYYYSNVLFKDNVLYFGYKEYLYSYNLSTQTLTKLKTYSSSDCIIFICFYNNDKLKLFIHDGNRGNSTVYEFEISSGTVTKLISQSTYSDGYTNRHYGELVVKANNYVYNFYYGGSSNTKYGGWKYNLVSDSYDYLTSWNNFVENLGFTSYTYLSSVFDNDRFIYIIGGLTNISKSDLIIRYDTINDTFELLDNKLIEAKNTHFSILVDNRIYMFGGLTWTENNNTYGRPYQIDYFDLSYPLTQNNAIITIANYKDDNALPLINTEKLKINSNIASAYLGNADNLAEKVNAYYWNGYGWIGINCDDYTEPESGGTGGGTSGGGDVTTDPEIPVDKPVEI